ncbi:hypothetical protein K0B96_07565 [Horticoccus luteus]|uniref:Cbb3-type cytochrome oxidase component FixQ n=2 Tax=Horticoccus luteus TaxID=2862869 RepID=A0A8F9XMU9_9BACT|nr:hypothetical protein K0B96_07565 [Horticoccus luteus]
MPPKPTHPNNMTTGGWINLVLSVGFVTTLFIYCIVRVVQGPKNKTDHDLAHVEPIEEGRVDER